VKTLVCAIGLCLLTPGCRPVKVPTDSAPGTRRFAVEIRSDSLLTGERISGISVTVSGGHISSVESIPADWFIELEPTPDGAALLRASANHGTSWLPPADALQPTFRVTPHGREGIIASATVTVSSVNGDRSIPATALECRGSQ
jgi:hypothetical protein